MKYFILIFSIVMSAKSALATADFYECTLPQAEEFRVGIDLSLKKAGFFDNDSTSIMTYTSSRPSSVNLENEVLIFTGRDNGGSGDLKLEFNLGTKRIKLSTVESDGTLELLGFTKCSVETPWDLSQSE